MEADQTYQQTSSQEEVKYKGVRKRKWGKWVSEIRLPNSRERIWLGSYDSPVKAARAFDAALYCLRGPGARFNFPENPPDFVLDGHLLTPQDIQLVASTYANQPTTTTQPTQQQQGQGQAAATNSAREGNNFTNTTSYEDDVVLVGPAVPTTGAAATTTTSNETGIDWSFLRMLDTQQPTAVAAAAASDHHFELFSGMDNMSMSMNMNMGGGDYYHHMDHFDDDTIVYHNQNHHYHHHHNHNDQMAGDEAYSYPSFLWNF
ncbi:Ethylene-responsive transcription factor ERF016 [Linum perenne]